jgi:hypothetical protein
MQLVPSGLRLVSLTCDPPLRASGHALRGMGAAAQAAAQRSVGAGADRFPRARRGHQDQQGVEESDDHSGTGWIKRTGRTYRTYTSLLKEWFGTTAVGLQYGATVQTSMGWGVVDRIDPGL